MNTVVLVLTKAHEYGLEYLMNVITQEVELQNQKIHFFE